MTRNDQLTLKATRNSEENQALEGSRKGKGKSKRGRGKGRGGRGGRGAKPGRGGKGAKGVKASPAKAKGGAKTGDGVKTRAGPFKNKKRARVQKASPKKHPKAKALKPKAKASKVAGVYDDVANAPQEEQTIFPVPEDLVVEARKPNTKASKRRRPRKASTSKAPVAEAATEEPVAKKRAPSKPKPKTSTASEGAATAVRGRRGRKAVVTEDQAECEGEVFECPHTFARRVCPPREGTEAWHLWRVIVRVFTDRIAPRIQDRSRTKKEVSGFAKFCAG